jgi:hypothetical protein
MLNKNAAALPPISQGIRPEMSASIVFSKTGFEPLSIPGFYVDAESRLYLYIREFLFGCHLPDRPEVRWPVLDELLATLGEIPVWLVEE